MSLIAAGVTAAAGLAGSLLGGRASRKARARQEAILKEREKRATDLYNRDYYKDYTQTAAAQNALSKARSLYNETLSRARGTQAVSGATDESVAAQKAAANNAIADAATNIAINGENQAQHAQDRYEAQKDAISKEREQIEADKAKQSAAAGAQALNTAAYVAGNMVDTAPNKTPNNSVQTQSATQQTPVQQTPTNAQQPTEKNITNSAAAEYDFAKDRQSHYPSYYDQSKIGRYEK